MVFSRFHANSKGHETNGKIKREKLVKKVVAIIQARWGSTRLPGKVLKLLNGRSVLDHVVSRCLHITGIDEVCCAIPSSSDSDGVAAEASRIGATVVRGSENDVLDRYYKAATKTKADIIMRITSDCPLIDPHLCHQVLHRFRIDDADYAANNSPPTWPIGLDCEVISFEWLQKAAQEATRPSEREHVTPYIRNNPNTKQTNLSCSNRSISHHRWTLDTPTDFQFMTEIFERLGTSLNSYSWLRTLEIVEKEPQLAAINAGIDRLSGYKKSLIEDLAAGFELPASEK